MFNNLPTVVILLRQFSFDMFHLKRTNIQFYSNLVCLNEEGQIFNSIQI